MAAFIHLALVKAHSACATPYLQDLADLTELCYLAAAMGGTTERISIPVSPDAAAPFENFSR